MLLMRRPESRDHSEDSDAGDSESVVYSVLCSRQPGPRPHSALLTLLTLHHLPLLRPPTFSPILSYSPLHSIHKVALTFFLSVSTPSFIPFSFHIFSP